MMKKLSIITVALLFSTASVFAQDDNRERVQIGSKIGLNYANIFDSEGEEFKAEPRLGFAAGAFLAIPIGTFIGIQPEVLFSQKKIAATGSILGSNYEFTRTSNYINIPLYITLKPSQFITFVAGPQFSYLLSRKDVFKSPFINTEVENDFKNENIRKNILGASFGLDININHFVFGARAAVDLLHNKGDGTSSTPRYKNSWIQATVGFKF